MSESPESPDKPVASETPPPPAAPSAAPVPAPPARPGRLRALVGAVPLALLASGLVGGLVGGGVVAVVADVGDDDDDRGHHRVIRFHEGWEDRERVFPHHRFHPEGPGRWEGPRGPGDGTFPRPVPTFPPMTPTPSPTPTP